MFHICGKVDECSTLTWMTMMNVMSSLWMRSMNAPRFWMFHQYTHSPGARALELPMPYGSLKPVVSTVTFDNAHPWCSVLPSFAPLSIARATCSRCNIAFGLSGNTAQRYFFRSLGREALSQTVQSNRSRAGHSV